MDPVSQRVVGLFFIHMKTTLTYDGLATIYRPLSDLFYDLLELCHPQEGQRGMNHEEFAEYAYTQALQTMDRVANLLGEDADVKIDLNLDAYQTYGLLQLRDWSFVRVSIGANTNQDDEGVWTFVEIQQASEMRRILALAHVM